MRTEVAADRTEAVVRTQVQQRAVRIDIDLQLALDHVEEHSTAEVVVAFAGHMRAVVGHSCLGPPVLPAGFHIDFRNYSVATKLPRNSVDMISLSLLTEGAEATKKNN